MLQKSQLAVMVCGQAVHKYWFSSVILKLWQLGLELSPGLTLTASSLGISLLIGCQDPFCFYTEAITAFGSRERGVKS